MTPLIDVIFLLLTFFIFALVLMVRAEVLDVKLPEISGGQAPSGDMVSIALDRAGRITIEAEPVSLESVPARVRELLEVRKGARLVIAVDRDGSSGALIRLADVLASSGLGEFSIIGTDAKEGRAASEQEP